MATPKVAYSLRDLSAIGPKDSAVTLGVFDGVHLGHRRIVEELVLAKKTAHVRSAFLMTFDPHPVVITHSKQVPPLLTTVEERIEILSAFDIDGIFVLGFDEQVAEVDYRTFLDQYLLQAFDMKLFVMGYDLHFGKNREGNPEKVRVEAEKNHFGLRIVPAVEMDGEAISSSKIRTSLLEGDLDAANVFLGHPYLISGEVVRGHEKGHSLGFPTANVSIKDPYKLWPAGGVYAVQVRVRDRMYDGMMNVGRAPTMKSLAGGVKEIEVHLFDFNGDLYGEVVAVYCHKYLRNEMTFPSPSALVRQLERDRRQAIRILNRRPAHRESGGTGE